MPVLRVRFSEASGLTWKAQVGEHVEAPSGQLMMNQGFKYCSAVEGSLLLMSELIFAGIAGVFLFGDLSVSISGLGPHWSWSAG